MALSKEIAWHIGKYYQPAASAGPQVDWGHAAVQNTQWCRAAKSVVTLTPAGSKNMALSVAPVGRPGPSSRSNWDCRSSQTGPKSRLTSGTLQSTGS